MNLKKSRNLKPTIFSNSEIFSSCWWICWFFISRTSFRLFRSSSMCLYGAKASWQKEVTSKNHQSYTPKHKINRFNQATVTKELNIMVLYCIVQQLPQFAHLCSCAELLQSAWLDLWGYDSETSACPPDPGDQTDINLLITNLWKQDVSLHGSVGTVYLQWQSDLLKLFSQRPGLLLMGHLEIWHETQHTIISSQQESNRF